MHSIGGTLRKITIPRTENTHLPQPSSGPVSCTGNREKREACRSEGGKGIDLFEFNEAGEIQTFWAYEDPAIVLAQLRSEAAPRLLAADGNKP
ncbi:hypothetical protein NITLEN_20463 [Nitrospira lenta]|uniref:Uncharacterized protein n=1 Tax=Nitrospira lenta TaxID=1436998 RepID=A0A330L4Y9_9BACT|nr:hypothetical protein NITLEN_20463 [Nitrospira lenta]